MTRNIKFRAWEKQLREMIPVYDIQFHNPQKVVVEGIELLPREQQPLIINTISCWRDAGEIELMQFTGLTDKNGTEIYEGDVCRDMDEGIYVIEYDDAEFVSIYDTNIREYLSETHDQIEVIGNIYQHPELISA